MSAPPHKRARPDSTSTPPAPVVSKPSLTLEDIKVLPPDASHKLILALLTQHPVTVPLITSHIDAIHSARKAAADAGQSADIRKAKTMVFHRFVDYITEPLTTKPYYGQDRVQLAEDIHEMVEDGVKMMKLGCEHNPTHERRLSAFRTMVEMICLLRDCPFESLADELMSEDDLIDGLEQVWRMAWEKGEAEKLRAGLTSELEELKKRYFSGRQDFQSDFRNIIEVVLAGKPIKESD